MTKPFSFCLSAALFFSPEWWSCWVEYLGLSVFPSNTLNTSCHSLLACRVSNETSAGSLMEVPPFVTLSLLLPFKFSLSLHILPFYLWYVSVCDPFVHLVWDPLWPLPGYLLPSSGKGCFQPLFYQIDFLPHFLSPPPGAPTVWRLVCVMLSQRFFKLSSF